MQDAPHASPECAQLLQVACAIVHLQLCSRGEVFIWDVQAELPLLGVSGLQRTTHILKPALGVLAIALNNLQTRAKVTAALLQLLSDMAQYKDWCRA